MNILTEKKNPVFWIFVFSLTFLSDMKMRRKFNCFNIYIDSEGNQDEKSNSENQNYTAQDQPRNKSQDGFKKR